MVERYFAGETCATDIDDCVGDACQNGGRCTDRVNGFDCDCSGTGFEGARCEFDVDECATAVCVHGQCINLPGSYKCDCQLGSPNCPHCYLRTTIPAGLASFLFLLIHK